MAFEKVGATLPGIVAGADLTGSQFLFTVIDSNGKAVVAGAGVAVDAVLQNKPDTDQAATLWGCGSVSKVKAGAAVSNGALVTPDAAGKAVAATTGNFIAGRALTAAGAADEIVSVWITQPGVSA